MRILHICAAYKPAYIYGGPTMSVSMLTEQLVKAGISAEVYTTTANGKKELPVVPNVKTYVDQVPVVYFRRLTKDHSHFSPALFSALWKESKNYDVIHIHAWWNLVSLLSCTIALARGNTVILSPRGTLSSYSFRNRNTGFKWLIHQIAGKHLLKKCYLHVTSLAEEENIKNLFIPKKIFSLPNFVKLPLERTKRRRQPSQIFRLIFFSRIEEKKGLDILINALALVNFPYSLTIAGDGEPNYIETLKELAAGNMVSESISWIGFQNDNKFELLAEHDLLILPSHDENFGNVVIESLSQGTPVLLSSFVGLASYVEDNDLGWTCALDPSTIAAKINYIHSLGEKLREIRDTAPLVIEKDYDTNSLTGRYIGMYDVIVCK